jgi:hypothetical protein
MLFTALLLPAGRLRSRLVIRCLLACCGVVVAAAERVILAQQPAVLVAAHVIHFHGLLVRLQQPYQ